MRAGRSRSKSGPTSRACCAPEDQLPAVTGALLRRAPHEVAGREGESQQDHGEEDRQQPKLEHQAAHLDRGGAHHLARDGGRVGRERLALHVGGAQHRGALAAERRREGAAFAVQRLHGGRRRGIQTLHHFQQRVAHVAERLTAPAAANLPRRRTSPPGAHRAARSAACRSGPESPDLSRASWVRHTDCAGREPAIICIRSAVSARACGTVPSESSSGGTSAGALQPQLRHRGAHELQADVRVLARVLAHELRVALEVAAAPAAVARAPGRPHPSAPPAPPRSAVRARRSPPRRRRGTGRPSSPPRVTRYPASAIEGASCRAARSLWSVAMIFQRRALRRISGSGSWATMSSAHCSTATVKSAENCRVRMRAFRSRVDMGRSGLLSETREQPVRPSSSAATSNQQRVVK